MDELNKLNFQIQEQMMTILARLLKTMDELLEKRGSLDLDGQAEFEYLAMRISFFIDILYSDGKTKSTLF